MTSIYYFFLYILLIKKLQKMSNSSKPSRTVQRHVYKCVDPLWFLPKTSEVVNALMLPQRDNKTFLHRTLAQTKL